MFFSQLEQLYIYRANSQVIVFPFLCVIHACIYYFSFLFRSDEITGYSNKQSSGSASDIVFWQTRLSAIIHAWGNCTEVVYEREKKL